MSGKSALLIGINQYPYLAEFAQLKGCHNDVLALKSLLEQKFGFAPENIRVLRDEEATRKCIIEAMNTVLANCQPEDCIVFFFSGHGSRLKARRKDKPSGWYETIMPFDSGRKMYHPEAVNRDITDDEIYEWLMALAEKTFNIVLIFDSCYSGSITREDIFEEGIRGGIPPPEDTVIHEKPAQLFFHSRPFTKENRGKGSSGWLPVSDKYVLFAASAEYERAHLFKEENGDEIIHYGAFSYFFCQTLRDAQSGATYRDIFERVYVAVKARFERQSVQLEGERDRELFGLKKFAPVPFLTVSSRENQFLTLSGGAIHGITTDSRWAIYPSGTKRLDREWDALGEAKIISVQAVTSKAQVLRESAPNNIKIGSRAMEVSRPKSSAGIKVKVKNGLPEFESLFNELVKNIRQSPFLELTDNKRLADASVYFTGNSSDPVNDSLPSLLIKQFPGQSLIVCGREGDLLMPPQSVNNSASAGIIIKNLERLSHYHRILELRNPQSILSGKIDFLILRQNQDLSWSEVEPDGNNSLPIIHESERIALRVVNRFDSPIFFTILDLGLCRDISVVYPPKGAKDIIGPLASKFENSSHFTGGKGVFTLGADDDYHIELFFPQGFPFDAPLPGGSWINEGLEVFKLIVTTRPHDLSFLEQTALRESRTYGNQIESLISGALVRGAQNCDNDPLSELENEWFTIEKPFLLRRK